MGGSRAGTVVRCAVAAALGLAVPAPAQPSGALSPPCDAVVTAPEAFIRDRPTGFAPPVGLVRRGSVLAITTCVATSTDPLVFDFEPVSCARDDAWALTDGGALRASLLEPAPAGQPPPEPDYEYAKVVDLESISFVRPDVRSAIGDRFPNGRVFALEPASAADPPGWRRRPDGRFVRAATLRPYTPDPFEGVHHPDGPIAFFATPATARPLGPGGSPVALPRHARLPALAATTTHVETPLGRVPRAAIRLAGARARPVGIPAGVRWMHLDLTEQVLTAYEGDRWVFATLVSTGREGIWQTHQGVFRVWHKALHERMHGAGYYVEEVPHIQFFSAGQALHGAFWHHAFGFRVSHGCVNLSTADARWLFDWTPPPLPRGWHSRMALASEESAWLVVEEAPPLKLPRAVQPPLGEVPECRLF